MTATTGAASDEVFRSASGGFRSSRHPHQTGCLVRLPLDLLLVALDVLQVQQA